MSKQTALSPNTMDLPKKFNGEVDWRTLGNILAAHALGEVLYASYIDKKYGSPQEGVLPATDWRYAYEEKDVVVLVKELEDSPIKCFMGRSVFDLPPKVIHDCISVAENTLHWDKYAVESRLVDSLHDESDIQDCISYMQHQATQCLVTSKRDLLFYVRNQHMRDSGKRVMSMMSVDYASCPVVHGVHRGQLGLGTGWVLEPYKGNPNRTLVSYLVNANLVGIPSLIINRVMRRQPLCIHYLHQFLRKPKREISQSIFQKLSFSKHKNVIHISSSPPPQISILNQPPLLVTESIPTPDICPDQTGYTFSAVTLGSNPLYNWSTWSASTVTNRDRDHSFNTSEEVDEGRDVPVKCDRRWLEESEVDFRLTSINSSEKRVRPRQLWIPSVRNSAHFVVRGEKSSGVERTNDL